ncbi:hypothetical protein TRIUR3_34252 [Triticum urartu]|uniref:Uncharacterized protein n=1 Tax=Triticum urartu TaxID=4572 RepID=M7ZMA7_TRIUA|nr:hypothetical protein TRIUR3_34252 [Triticum urartu]
MGGQRVEDGRPPSNLQRFLDCTTPTVDTHILPKTETLLLIMLIQTNGRLSNDAWHHADADSLEYFNLADLWEQYYEWSAYGAGATVQLHGGDKVVQYYVPYLSGIQLYTNKVLNASRSFGEDYGMDFWSDDDDNEKMSRSWSSTSDDSFNCDVNDQKANTVSLAPFGLAANKIQGSLWTNPRTGDHKRIVSLFGAADSWLKQLGVRHHDFNYFVTHPMRQGHEVEDTASEVGSVGEVVGGAKSSPTRAATGPWVAEEDASDEARCKLMRRSGGDARIIETTKDAKAIIRWGRTKEEMVRDIVPAWVIRTDVDEEGGGGRAENTRAVDDGSISEGRREVASLMVFVLRTHYGSELGDGGHPARALANLILEYASPPPARRFKWRRK